MTKNSKVIKELFDQETRSYYGSITSKPLLCLPIVSLNSETTVCYSGLPTAVILWIYEEYKLSEFIELILVSNNTETDRLDCDTNRLNLDSDSTILLNLSRVYPNVTLANGVISSNEKLECLESSAFKNCVHESICRFRPLVVVQEKHLLVSGLSSIARFLVKFSQMKLEHQLVNTKENADKHAVLQSLMGFRGGCLQACAEVSVWTKFCEFDVVNGLENAIKGIRDKSSEKIISKEILRFEYHLLEPVKVYNIRKYASLKNKNKDKKESMSIDNDNSFGLKHEFAEGPDMLISDLILYCIVNLFMEIYGASVFEKHVPNTSQWYSKMDLMFRLSQSKKLSINQNYLQEIKHNENIENDNKNNACKMMNSMNWKVPQVPKESLYKNDTTRYNPTSRLFTRPTDVQDAIDSFSSSGISLLEITKANSSLNWDEIPLLAQPEGGSLPAKRREKKCQQLTGMIGEVMKVLEKVKENSSSTTDNVSSSLPLRIVDFCSGGGHVGILLAWLLPKCQIFLVENKEESLRRGWERIAKLGLTNVVFYQCNLDYFDLKFDIGVALHACGTATDLVLAKCAAANASFVCCPCCYGSVQSNHILHYPRSKRFKDSIELKHYFIFAHCSDQTHDEKHEKTQQGNFCMQLIDTDRCLCAQESGYTVHLTKILPETASPKNQILVGVSSPRRNNGISISPN